jgi:hypothetical protein
MSRAIASDGVDDVARLAELERIGSEGKDRSVLAWLCARRESARNAPTVFANSSASTYLAAHCAKNKIRNELADNARTIVLGHATVGKSASLTSRKTDNCEFDLASLNGET